MFRCNLCQCNHRNVLKKHGTKKVNIYIKNKHEIIIKKNMSKCRRTQIYIDRYIKKASFFVKSMNETSNFMLQY